MRDITWKKIKERYYWRGGQAYVAKKVKECIACAYKNNSIWKAGLPPLTAIPVIPKPFWRINVDFLGAFTRSRNGNAYVGLAVCAFTKFVEAAGKNQNKKLSRESIVIPSRSEPTTTGGGVRSPIRLVLSLVPPGIFLRSFFDVVPLGGAFSK